MDINIFITVGQFLMSECGTILGCFF